MLNTVHLSRNELARYVARQMEAFFPDGRHPDAHAVLAAHLDAALARLGR